jgi:hypothetical protein
MLISFKLTIFYSFFLDIFKNRMRVRTKSETFISQLVIIEVKVDIPIDADAGDATQNVARLIRKTDGNRGFLFLGKLVEQR